MSESSSSGQSVGQVPPPGQGDPSWAETASLLALRQVTRIAEQLPGAVARRAGLSHNEMRTLELLVDGISGPAEIARVLGVTTAAASGIIDRLEEHGHATRGAHATDRRRTSVTISDAGRAELVPYLLPMYRELARLDAELDERDRDVVARYLTGVARAMRSIL